ncbi:MAG: 3-hydroxyacyl-ACP dehydratase FabZ [Deinococcaceae bacterium]
MSNTPNIQNILHRLPHRFPFLLIDRVLEVSERHVRALKNVTINEPFFQGHFPTEPVMPGVLILEAMAQASTFVTEGVLPAGEIVYLVGIEEARFKKPVVPGDQLILEAQLEFFRRGIGKTAASATVDGELVAQAKILFAASQTR